MPRNFQSVFDEADADRRGFVSEATAVKLIRQINQRLALNRVVAKVKVSQRVTEREGDIYCPLSGSSQLPRGSRQRKSLP